jgi:hypothetical protein
MYCDRKGSVEKKTLAVSLKGLDAKTNCLAVNRQCKETCTLTLRVVS